LNADDVGPLGRHGNGLSVAGRGQCYRAVEAVALRHRGDAITRHATGDVPRHLVACLAPLARNYAAPFDNIASQFEFVVVAGALDAERKAAAGLSECVSSAAAQSFLDVIRQHNDAAAGPIPCDRRKGMNRFRFGGGLPLLRQWRNGTVRRFRRFSDRRQKRQRESKGGSTVNDVGIHDNPEGNKAPALQPEQNVTREDLELQKVALQAARRSSSSSSFRASG
jgi:hypothetical protein